MTGVDLNQSGIYSITSPSGKRYIGSAVNIKHRWGQHRSMLIRGAHHCKALQRAYIKYHGDFVWSVLVLCPKEELIREEQQQMDWAGVGTLYNANPVAGSMLGFRHTQETKDKISAVQAGTVRGEYSPEHKAAISLARKGKALTQRHKRALAGVKKRSNTSGYVGVAKASRGNKWYATRCINGRLLHLGTYPTAELANQARQNFDRILRYYDE